MTATPTTSPTVAIVQARLTSTRLPGKVLMELAGRPLLAHVIERLRRASTLDEVVVATSVEAADDPIVEFCQAIACRVTRGSRDDVLDRYYQAAREVGAATVVRITSDCPLIDPDLVDDVVGAFQRLLPDVDYVSNTLAPRSYPRGLDAEVFHVETLACAWRDDDNPAWREHVTPYLYRHPERFCLHRVGGEEDHSSLRWTVDTPEDFELVRRIYAHFGGNRFTWRQALALVEAQPELRSLNAAIVQKTLT